MEDKRIVSDPCTFSGIKNGKYTDFVKDTDSLNGLYVANPKVPSNFHDSEFKIKLTFIWMSLDFFFSRNFCRKESNPGHLRP